ncbi:MAG TPA: PP2C family protein-serine/threonine phosphatase [Pirellulales bacterium]
MADSWRYALRKAFRVGLSALRRIVYFPRRQLSRWSVPDAPPATTVDGTPARAVHRIRCAEVWGGIHNADLECVTSGVRASLHSSACDGGRGGDVYYFSVCGADSLTRVALADVTGHGEAVSRVGQWLYDALAARMNSLRGDRVLGELNDLAEHYGFAAISTLAVVQYYRRKTRLYVSYAGHPPALVFRQQLRTWQPAEVPEGAGLVNLPIGVSDQTHYQQHAIPLASGDRVLLYTDGVLEAPGRDGSQFGLERLVSIAQASNGKTLFEFKTAVMDAVREHTGGPLEHDDVTVLAMEVI